MLNYRLLFAASALALPFVVQSADPPDGALTDSNFELSYTTGPMPVPNVGENVVAGGHYECSEINPCDTFLLTVDLSEEFIAKYPRPTVIIATAATPEYADIDLQLADEQGKNIGLTRDNPPAQPSLSFRPVVGKTVYQVQIVPGTPVPDASATITLNPGQEAKSGPLAAFGGAVGWMLLLPLLGLAWRRSRR